MKTRYLFTTTAAALLTAGAAAPASAAEFTFDDIDRWYGSGDNRSAMIIDWNDGKAPVDGQGESLSLAWGYQWNGDEHTVEDMLLDVVQADDRLFAKLGDFGFGISIFGLGYDGNDDGYFGITDGTDTIEYGNGTHGLFYTDDDHADGSDTIDPADRYQEGWWTDGFWSQWVNTTDEDIQLNPYGEGDWESPGVGISSRTLLDEGWNAFSFAPGFDSSAPSQPVPEPASLALLGTGATLMLFRRRPDRG